MAVRTPTTEATRARSLAVAAAVPKNMHVAAFYASLEWWRTKALCMEVSSRPFSVLSLSNGSPDYDREVVTHLSSKCRALSYTIVEPSRAHSRLAEDPRLSKIITLSPASNLEEFAKSYRETKGAKAGFDVVHVSLWRNQGWADTLATLQTALGLLNANGSAVLFCNGSDGVFKLRSRFADRLGPTTPGAATASEESLAKVMSSCGLDTRTELLRSLVDITSCTTFTPNAFVFRTFSDMLLCNMETAAAKDATLLSELTSAMLDTSVASSSERCVVYTPLHVLVGVKKATSPFAPAKPAAAILQPKVDPWWPHGEKGGFFNIGLQNWHGVRKQWKSYGHDDERMPKPPLVDVEDVTDELSKLRRTYTLPAPLSLSDILDIFVDIWDDEEMR